MREEEILETNQLYKSLINQKRLDMVVIKILVLSYNQMMMKIP